MAPRRKSSKRKSKSRFMPLLMAGAAAINRQVARHPAAVGGTVCFFVIFGFVSANALWYQPGRHPAPFLKTRDPAHFSLLSGVRRSPLLDEQNGRVTTFRIERETASGPGGNAAETESSATAAPDSSLILAVQQELVRQGLLTGTPDGVAGPVTTNAISTFQTSVGMAPTGEATPELLAALKVDGGATAAVPLPRPAAQAESGIDPVAAAILNAQATLPPEPAHPAAKPPANPAAQPAINPAVQPAAQSAARPKPVSTPGAVASAKPPSVPDAASAPAADPVASVELIMEIQRGLSNIAYTDVSVDGVAGAQTRAAIRHFEHHYRLPETGEPNEQVLAKLRSIGAL